MVPRARLLTVALALAAAGCNARSGSSFTPPSKTVPIPAGAQLLVCAGGWASRLSAPREVFAVAADGSGLTRITFCNDENQACDNVAVAPASDRVRLAVARVLSDTNKDEFLGPPDEAALMVVDLARRLEAPIVPPAEQVHSVDWSPAEDLLVYGARGTKEGDEDIYRSSLSGKDRGALLTTITDRERRLRIDPTGQAGVFERVDTEGRGSLWGLTNAAVRVTDGPAAGGALPGSDYALGSDSAPAFSPDNKQLVFRRLTGQVGRLETWDIVVRNISTGAEAVIVAGPAFRDAPDWGPGGIAFVESDATSSRLVVVAADGTGRRVPVTLPAGTRMSSARWLAAPR